MISAEMLLRCPRRRFGKRSSLWAPPTQWTMRTISEAALSISATTSWIRVRTMRFLTRASVVGADQTVRRLDAMTPSEAGATAGAGVLALCAASLPSTSATWTSALFQRASSSLATSRFGGGSGIVLPEGPAGGMARRLEVAPETTAPLIPPFPGLLGGGGCRGDSARTDDAKQCFLDCIIDAQSAEGDAVRAAIVHPGAAAAVARNMVLYTGVPECKLAAAALAPDQTGKQRVTMLGRAMMPTGGNVAADHGADRLEPLPAHVPFVGVGLQRQPFVPRLAADLHAHALGAVSRRHSRLTIGIGAAVDRVINDPVDGGVARSPPGRVAVGLLHRQIEIVLVEPAERLSRAAQFLDLVEHQLDRFLDTPIRIFLITVTGLHEADGRCHNQRAPARLLVAGRERALAQQIQLVLVEASLEPEQQAVIAVPWRIDGLLIDQNGVDHAAHLDELLPIPAVASEARDLAGANRTNLTEANLRYYSLKASALYPAGG